MTYRIAVPGLLACLMILSGCHPLRALRNVRGSCHDVQPYTKAQSIAPLRIPAGLDAPDTSNALHVPALNEPAPPPRGPKDPCLDSPPAFKVAKPAPPQA
ncbi:MAG TPA: hypothetical protein VFO44_16290 [Steroidobacteraceae bacterium]|nr:hypothetical protein [Steroidobacteraceae bacterium]